MEYEISVYDFSNTKPLWLKERNASSNINQN